jgi:hypothetical protein
LERDLEFFRGEVLGQEIEAYTGPTNGKGWHRLRGECLLRLKEAKVDRMVRRELLPPVRPWSDDPDRRKEEEERREDGDDKAIKRAKKRRKTQG